MSFDIRNNEIESRYETTIEGHTAYAAYDLEGEDRIVFTHTVVPEELSGRGIAGAVVKYALDDVRGRGLKVVPQCPYVAAYLQKHPEYQDVLAQGGEGARGEG